MKRSNLLTSFTITLLFVLIGIAGCSSYGTKNNSGIIIGKANKVNGIFIHEVANGGPAEEAGIKTGDIIVSYDGNEITDMEKLEDRIEDVTPGEKVVLEVMRGGSLFNVGVTFKKKGWKILNVDTTDEFPNYSINVVKNFLWIGAYPFVVELTLEEMTFSQYRVFDQDRIPTPPTFFSITLP